MADEKVIYPCLHFGRGDIPERVLVCGDPARAEAIAGRLEDSRCVAKNREYWTFSGRHKGVPVAVSSHGVGCGGASIAFEGLWRAGVKVVIRVGTCGGMQPHIKEGSLVVATGACREEGVTDKMIPPSYPAIASSAVVQALMQAAADNKVTASAGIVLTQALFYGSFLPSTVKLYAKAGVLAMENEAAGLLVVASLHGMQAGAILTADAPAFELVGPEGYHPDTDLVNNAVKDSITVALDAIVAVPITNDTAIG